jgi:phage tail-like protein
VPREFTVNINRHDPYKNYRFLVYFAGDTNPVAGVSKVSGLKRSSDVIEYKEGGNAVAVKGLGRTKYEPVTLERGVTHDPSFEDWANAALRLDMGHGVADLPHLRKEVRIELQNEQGQTVQAYLLHACWVSEYQALPDLDAAGNAIAVEHIKIENEGWERDLTVTEPNEANLDR